MFGIIICEAIGTFGCFHTEEKKLCFLNTFLQNIMLHIHMQLFAKIPKNIQGIYKNLSSLGQYGNEVNIYLLSIDNIYILKITVLIIYTSLYKVIANNSATAVCGHIFTFSMFLCFKEYLKIQFQVKNEQIDYYALTNSMP